MRKLLLLLAILFLSVSAFAASDQVGNLTTTAVGGAEHGPTVTPGIWFRTNATSGMFWDTAYVKLADGTDAHTEDTIWIFIYSLATNDSAASPSGRAVVDSSASQITVTGSAAWYAIPMHHVASTASTWFYAAIVCRNNATGANKYNYAWSTAGTPTTVKDSLYYAVSSASTGPTYNVTSWKNAEAAYALQLYFVRTDGGSAPDAPTLSSPSDAATGQSTSPTLVCNASSGATSYTLQVSTSSAPGGTSAFSTTVYSQSGLTVSNQVTGLSNNTTYYWHYSATNGNGTSVYSTARSFTTEAAATSGDRVLIRK